MLVRNAVMFVFYHCHTMAEQALTTWRPQEKLTKYISTYIPISNRLQSFSARRVSPFSPQRLKGQLKDQIMRIWRKSCSYFFFGKWNFCPTVTNTWDPHVFLTSVDQLKKTHSVFIADILESLLNRFCHRVSRVSTTDLNMHNQIQ